jgi:hypothetical protein
MVLYRLGKYNIRRVKNMWTFLDRLKEPSTYAGLSGLMLAVGLTQEEWSIISSALAGIAGVIAMVLKDRK